MKVRDYMTRKSCDLRNINWNVSLNVRFLTFKAFLSLNETLIKIMLSFLNETYNKRSPDRSTNC